MSSGCGDVISLEDLRIAKLHQLFEAEVITGLQGGVPGGAEIDYATNQVTGQVQKTLPAVLRDAGFRPASFTFTTGGTLGVNDADLAVLWPIASGGDGAYYSWKGALPKVIPASSTPAGTGGVSSSGWVQLGDLTLRANLASSADNNGDALVAVKQPYTGSVARTQHSKNSEHISVLDFGADKTGATECLTAFNAAASVSGFVEVPPGIYLLSSATNPATWFIHPGVTLLGQANVGTAGGGVPNFSYLTGRVYNHSAGGQIGLKIGSSSSWLTGSFRDPIEYISETVSVAKSGGYGIVGASRASDDPTPNMNTIGVGAFGYNDYATSPNPAWASYMEGRRESGTGPLFGIELDFVNNGYNFIETPINIVDPYSATSPVIGIRLSSGGGVGGNPSSTAIDINSNGATWNAGMLFREGSLTDGKAICMPVSYSISYYDGSGNISGIRNGTGEDLLVESTIAASGVTDTYRKRAPSGFSVTGDKIYQARFIHYPFGSEVVGGTFNYTQVNGARVGVSMLSNNDTGVAIGLLINSAANNTVTPNVNNAITLGTSSFRWSAVYAANGTIQTSDATMKDFMGVEDKEIEVGFAIAKLFRKYKWKLGDNKIHFGVSAQEVMAVFEKYGLNGLDYGALNYEDGIYGVNYAELHSLVLMSISSKI